MCPISSELKIQRWILILNPFYIEPEKAPKKQKKLNKAKILLQRISRKKDKKILKDHLVSNGATHNKGNI